MSLSSLLMDRGRHKITCVGARPLLCSPQVEGSIILLVDLGHSFLPRVKEDFQGLKLVVVLIATLYLAVFVVGRHHCHSDFHLDYFHCTR